jgi:hypothetical protein
MAFPGWGSVEAAARWHRGFEIAGFLALGLLLLCEVLAYIYGNHRDTLAIEAEHAASRERSTKEQQANEKRNAELAAANQRAEQAEKKVAEVAQAAADRVLTPEQRKNIGALLAAHPKYKIYLICNMGDQEGFRFMKPFLDLFRDNGWDIGASPAQGMYTNPPVGVQIVVNDGRNPPPGFFVVRDALTQAGVEFVPVQNHEIAPDIVELRIGSKPLK